MYVIDLVEEDPIKMEWTIVILFAAALLLLILSFVKTKQSSKTVDQQIEELSYSFTNEIKELQQQIHNMELDAEITAQEAGILPGASKQRILLREVLDLYKRKYSFESIAQRTQLTPYEVEHLLTPYLKAKNEGSNVTNEI
jgi:cell division protein FtsL